MHIRFPELYEQCGACAGTRTTIETSSDGKPFRKSCRTCGGSGSIPRRARVVGGGDHSRDDSGHDEGDEQAAHGLESARAEWARAHAAVIEWVMQAVDLSYDQRVAFWVRLDAVRRGLPEPDGTLQDLVYEARALGLKAFAHELNELEFKGVQLMALEFLQRPR
jgi:hypothetical protein